MKYIVPVLFVFILFGCEKSIDIQINEIVKAKDLWENVANTRDYKFDRSMQWNGSSEPTVRTITVVSGKSSLPATSKRHSMKSPLDISTIKGLFEYTFEEIKNKKRKVTVTYDKIYGFPNMITVTTPNIFDESTTIKILKLEFIK